MGALFVARVQGDRNRASVFLKDGFRMTESPPAETDRRDLFLCVCSQSRAREWMEGDDFNTEAVMNICGECHVVIF